MVGSGVAGRDVVEDALTDTCFAERKSVIG